MRIYPGNNSWSKTKKFNEPGPGCVRPPTITVTGSHMNKEQQRPQQQNSDNVTGAGFEEVK